MKLSVLGCSGGIGGNLRTTSFLLDQDVLIDAGTGVNELGLTELSLIDHIFITHSHFDHIACIPMLIDSVGFMRDKPVTLYAIPETLKILEEHIFNWRIWPDFSKIPNIHAPFLAFRPIQIGETIDLNGRKITAVPAHHVVPSVGYQLDSGTASLVFTGDTTVNDEFWPVINNIANLRYLVIETAFSDNEIELARLSKHLCPSMLVEELKKLKRPADIFITHLKPGEAELTMRQIAQSGWLTVPKMLLNKQVFDF